MGERRRSRLTAGVAILALLTPLLAGCGGGAAEVSGTVTYQGKPMGGGSVILYCADGQIVHGLVGSDGRYSIPNVPHGHATVTVQAHSNIPAGLRMKQSLPPSVDSPTPPAREVPADRPAATIPSRYGLPEESGLSVVVDRPRVTFDVDLKP